MEKLNIDKAINWSEISRVLADGKTTAIRADKEPPKKYREKVKVLRGLFEYWKKFYLND